MLYLGLYWTWGKKSDKERGPRTPDKDAERFSPPGLGPRAPGYR